jgi:rubrerythrin
MGKQNGGIVVKETLRNLSKAFIGESQARNRYTLYAKRAEKDGYQQLAAIFLETADHEREHAKWLMRFINQLKEKSSEDLSMIEVDSVTPTVLGNNVENLKAAIQGETYEFETMYPEFADVAEKEGLKEIAERLRAIGRAEMHHAERYSKLLKQVEDKTIFKKPETVTWICRKCGYEESGDEPPEKCPACQHPRGWYQLKCEQY